VNGYGINKLPYPLTYVTRLEFPAGNFISGDTGYDWGDCNVYTLVMTHDETRRFTSALQAGYDLIYPDTWQTDLDIWLQAREFVNTYQSGRDLASMCADYLTFCQKMEQCLNDSPELIDGVRETSDGWGQEELLTDGSLDENLLPVGFGCTDDELYGMALYITEEIIQSVLDALERIYAQTLAAKVIKETIEMIPGAQLVTAVAPFGQVVNVAQTVTEYLYLLYLAADTEPAKKIIACELWCIMKDDCTLTMTELRELIFTGIPSLPTSNTMSDFIDWVINTDVSSWANAQLLKFGMALAIEAVAHGGFFGKYFTSVQSLRDLALYGADESDNGWMLCTPCVNTWVHTIDFTLSDGGFVVWSAAPRGFYSAGVGWEDSNSGIRIWAQIPAAQLTNITVTADCTGGGTSEAFYIASGQYQAGNWSGTAPTSNKFFPSLIAGQFDYSADVDLNANYINLYASFANMSMTMLSITFSGTGANPF